jgi:hypothetical protein
MSRGRRSACPCAWAWHSAKDQNYLYDATATGEILSGTGRFAGITGSLTFTGKNLKPIKGEAGARSTLDYTFTYTLPAK